MFRGILPLTLSLCLGAATAPAALAQSAAPITEQEAHAIAVDAYVYFYSHHVDGYSRKQFTNGTTDFRGPMNTFVNVPEYPPADFKGVVRSNFDTLYSVSWLDMTKEPVVISAPDTDGRYYLLPMLDMWTDVFASPGWRTTGTKAGTFLVAPAGWRPDLRDRFTEEFRAAKGHPTDRRADALRLDYRPHQDGRPAGLPCGSQDPGRLQGHPAFRVWQNAQAGRIQARPQRRHEDAAEDPGRYA